MTGGNRLFKWMTEIPKEYDHRTEFGNLEIEGKIYFVGVHPEHPPVKIDPETGDWTIINPEPT